ncbi:MAG: type II toxin-antitoxin system RelE/ParE family toxin [Methylobacter sp.]
MKIVWSEPARQDLRDIFLYIAEENPKAARALLSEIKERAILLQENPLIGRIGRIDETRVQVIIYANDAAHKLTASYRLEGFF